MQITCHSGFKFIVEKNEVITVTAKRFRKDKNDESMSVPMSFNITINNCLANEESSMGNKYFIYSASSSKILF